MISIGPKFSFCDQVASPFLCSSSSAKIVTAWVSLSSAPNASSKSIRDAPAEQVAQDVEPALERDGRADVAGVDDRRRRQQVAERDAEAVGVVGLPRGLERDPAQLERQRRRAVQVGPFSAKPAASSAPASL